MASRLGIELSPAACRIVEVDGRAWRRSSGEVRVRSFAVMPPTGPELRDKLESLRRRPAAVVVWGGRSEHRQVMVTDGTYEAMRAEALASLSAAGLQTSRVWADIAPAPGSGVRGARRPVVVSMASAVEISEALQPLRDAGIWLRTVTTPAVALGSLARQRIDFAPPDAIEAYVALDQQVTCIALVRRGVLLAARELPWGYTDPNYTYSEPRTFEEITAQLGDAITEFVGANGGSARDIGQVCLCGGLPELRTMSTALMQRLDVEVEPLDSLFGIDASRLPAPADEFRERGAELRLAWAAATAWPPPINLLRSRRRQVSTAWFARAAVVAGAAAGLTGSWWAVERSHLLPALPVVTRVASNTPAHGREAARVTPRPAPSAAVPAKTASAPVVVEKAPAIVPPPAVAVNKAPVVPPPPPAVAVNKAPVVPPPPPVVAANKTPAVVPPTMASKAPIAVLPPVVAVNKAPAVAPPATVVSKAPVAAVPPPVVASNKPAAIAPPPAVANKAPIAAPPPVVAANKAPVVTPPPVAANKAPVVTPPPVVANKAPAATPPAVVAANKAPAVVPPPAVVAANKPPVVVPPPPVANRAPAIAPPPIVATKAPVTVAPSVAASNAPPPPVVRPAVLPPPMAVANRFEAAPMRAERAPQRVKAAPPAEEPMPFDAALGTILFSPDRRLAIIDDRIVGIGDEVHGARIVEISSGAVLLRDGQGRLRRLGLGALGAGAR